MNAQTLAAALLTAGTLTAGGLFAAADTPAPAPPPCAATACSPRAACSGGGCGATEEKALARLTGRFNVQMKARDFYGALRTAKQACDALPGKSGPKLMVFKAMFAANPAADKPGRDLPDPCFLPDSVPKSADCPATCTGSDCCEAMNCCESGPCCDGPACCETAEDCPPAPVALAATCDAATPATAVAVCSATSEAAPPSPAVCGSVCSSPRAATCVTAAFDCAPCEPAAAIVRTAGVCGGGLCGEGGCPVPSKLRAVFAKVVGTGVFAPCCETECCDTTCCEIACCETACCETACCESGCCEEETDRFTGSVALGVSAAGPQISVTCLDRETGETLTGLKALKAVLWHKLGEDKPAVCDAGIDLAKYGEPGYVKVERTYADCAVVEYEVAEAADCPCPSGCACPAPCGCESDLCGAGSTPRIVPHLIEDPQKPGTIAIEYSPVHPGAPIDLGITSRDAPCELPPPTPAGLYGLVQTASAAPAASVTPVSYAVAAPAGGLPVGSWSRTLNDQRVTLAVTADGSFRGTCTVPNGGCAIAFAGDCRCTADGLLFGAVTGARVVCKTGDSAADPVACVAAEGFCRTLIDQPFSARCRVTDLDGAPTMTVSHAMFGGIGFLGTPAPGEPAHLPLTMFSGAYAAE